ncbi:hypothetical protein GOODEAATRI_029796 [Goodea atripinnis]|uniref:Uncharacterized protein n=1 Tax=Goodea atripinnis TaxID=208336 RepID=A0ABV0NYR8_9TELE
MYSAFLSTILRRRPLLSIKYTSTSPRCLATPRHLVPSANSMQCVSAWKLSSNLRNFLMSVIMLKSIQYTVYNYPGPAFSGIVFTQDSKCRAPIVCRIMYDK